MVGCSKCETTYIVGKCRNSVHDPHFLESFELMSLTQFQQKKNETFMKNIFCWAVVLDYIRL